MENVIYKISNTVNEKIYIGSAKKLNTRINVHKSCLRKGNHHSKKLQNHVNKYGIDTLVFEVLECCDNYNVLIEREQYYIDKLKPFFNILSKADSRLGIKHTEESIKKMVETRRERGSYKKGIKRPDYVVKKIVESRKGYVHSQETKDKIRASLKKRVLSEEWLSNVRAANSKRKGTKMPESFKKKMSDIQKTEKNNMRGKKGVLHHFYGKKHSEETKRKISQSKKPRKVIDIDTGVIYNSVKECSEITGIPKGTLSKYLLGMIKSKTNFKYYEEKV